MSVHFWMGDKYDNTHENVFAAEIARYLDDYYRQKEEEAHVVFNFKLPVLDKVTKIVKNWIDHDLVVLTRRKLFDIEMKNIVVRHGGVITISDEMVMSEDEIVEDKIRRQENDDSRIRYAIWCADGKPLKGGSLQVRGMSVNPQCVDEKPLEAGKGWRTPFGQVEDHRRNMAVMLRYNVDDFYKEKHPQFSGWRYVSGVLLFPRGANISQPKDRLILEKEKTEGLDWFNVTDLVGLKELLSSEASGRETQLSSEEMLTLVTKYFKVKPAKLDENGMPYIPDRRSSDELKGIKTASVQKDGGNKNSSKHSVISGQDASSQNGEPSKVEMPKEVNPSSSGTKSQAPNREPQPDAVNHLNENAKRSQREQKDVKESEGKPKSANAQGCGCSSSTGQDSSATELRKDYVDYPVTQVQVSPVRIQILEAFLRCFCSEWSPISLVSRLFRQKTGIDVTEFVGYDLDTLSRDPVGGKLLKWRRADKYPHKLEISAIGGKMGEPSLKTVSRVRIRLKDAKPGEVDYVEAGRSLCLRPEMVMVAHVLKIKEV